MTEIINGSDLIKVVRLILMKFSLPQKIRRWNLKFILYVFIILVLEQKVLPADKLLDFKVRFTPHYYYHFCIYY